MDFLELFGITFNTLTDIRLKTMTERADALSSEHQIIRFTIWGK